RDRELPTRRPGPCPDRGWWLPADRSARSPRFLRDGNRSPATRSRWFCAAGLAPKDTRGSNRNRPAGASRRPCACSFSSAKADPRLFPAPVAIVRSQRNFDQQTEHALSQARKHRFGQRDFACPVTVHLAAEQHVRTVLHQRYKTDLRIRTGAAARSRARESIFVDLLVGYIEGAAIQAHQ